MNTKRQAKRNLTFAELPRDYSSLCGILTPRRIRDAADYASTVEVTDLMAGHDLNADQEDYFDTLCTLIEAYDAEHVKWKKVKPLKLLKYLLEENDLTGADLSRILGASSRHLGPMILRGERQITAEHARSLGARFHVRAGAFIE
jgi:HTH-type transcriptional regulator/antitoxin HigA